ncbi:MAG: ATP-binding protein [Bacteroidota bacterium]|nr:ATP-binding protein [Bacteroidota bacterium]
MNDSTLKNARILIVDDEQANVDVLSGLLEFKEYVNIYTTTDSRLVADLFKEINPDIILLDLMMPHLTGFQVMEQLAELVPVSSYLPILVLTADVSAGSKLRALAGGAKDFVTKPFDLTEVDLRIRNLLQTRYLHTQLQNQNLILEQKVQERTLELQNTILELEVAKTKAEASDRLKTAFLNNISHEVRTPLNGILGFSQIIAEEEISSEEKQEYIGMLNGSCDRLVNTITSYMDISLIVSGNQKVKNSTVDVHALMKEQFDCFKDKCAAKNLQLILKVPESTSNFIMKTDKELLRKIVTHLTDNAIKFTTTGHVIIGYDLKDAELELFVKDTGKGISEEAQERIFDRFMQENITNTRGYEGSGLGLSITKGFVELLGGRIRLESEKDKGTALFITLPGH